MKTPQKRQKKKKTQGKRSRSKEYCQKNVFRKILCFVVVRTTVRKGKTERKRERERERERGRGRDRKNVRQGE